MKKLLLAVLLATSMSAMASSRDDPMNQGSIVYQNMGVDMATYSSTLSTNSNTNTLASTNSGGTATGIGGDVSIKTERPLPNAPGMGASSSNTTSLHRKLNQKTISIIFGGFTSVTMDLDVISFWQTNPSEELQLAACFDGSQAYKDFKKELSQRPDSKVLACPN